MDERINEYNRGFDSQISYEFLLLNRISKVLDNIDRDGDGYSEFKILLMILIPEVKDDIVEEINNLYKERKESLKNIVLPDKLTDPRDWNMQVDKFDRRTNRLKEFRANKHLVQKGIVIIIRVLDKHSLLLRKEKLLEIGGYKPENESETKRQ